MSLKLFNIIENYKFPIFINYKIIKKIGVFNEVDIFSNTFSHLQDNILRESLRKCNPDLQILF